MTRKDRNTNRSLRILASSARTQHTRNKDKELIARLSEALNYLAEGAADWRADRSELLRLQSNLAKAREKIRLTEMEMKTQRTLAKDRGAEVSERKSRIKQISEELKREKAAHRAALAALNQSESKFRAASARMAIFEASYIWKIVFPLIRFEARINSYIGSLRRKWRHQKSELADIAASGLFDLEWYKAQYPDVETAKIDPVLHYLRYGAVEGRDPGPHFSSRSYLRDNPDVAKSGMNPLLHYLRYGANEGRASIAISGGQSPAQEPSVHSFHSEPALPASPPLHYAFHPAEILTNLSNRDGRSESGAEFEFGEWLIGLVSNELYSDLAQSMGYFAQLHGMGTSDIMRLHVNGTVVMLPSHPDEVSDPNGQTRIVQFGKETTPDFDDIWFTNDRNLRLRIQCDAEGTPTSHVLHCFQLNPLDEKMPVQLLKAELPTAGIAFADISTLNPFFPLFFILCSSDGDVVSFALLPFPSLCRGGLHYGELLAASQDRPYVQALRDVSGFLFRNWKECGDRSALTLIEVDLAEATGAERIFGPDIRTWLDGLLNVSVQPGVRTDGIEEASRAWLEEAVRLEPRSSPDEAGRTLQLPADAVPTLHALLVGSSDREAVSIAPFILAQTHSGKPAWLMSPPPLPIALLSVQPIGANTFPALLNESASSEPLSELTNVLPYPMAIRFRDLAAPSMPRLIAPYPPEISSRQIAGVAADEGPSVTIACRFSGDLDAMAAVLEALSLQDYAGHLDIRVSVTSEAEQPIAALVRRHFPETGKIVICDPDDGIGAQLDRAAKEATTELLLIMGEDVLLHDRRSLAVLAALMGAPQAGSAGCMLIGSGNAKKPNHLDLIHAGHCLTAGLDDERSLSPAEFSDALAALHPATWPMAANSSRLFMARTADWHDMGGFALGEHYGTELETPFWLNCRARGNLHLTTLALSATLLPVDGLVSRRQPLADCIADPSAAEISISTRRIIA